MSKTIKVSTQKLKSAKDSLSKTAALFKKAQEGQMGPDEVKEFAEEAVTVLDQAQELVETIIAEVPVSEPPIAPRMSEHDDDERMLESQIEEEEDDEKKKMLLSKLAKLKSAKAKIAAEHLNEDEKNAQEDDEKEDEQNEKIAGLEKTITDMQYKTAKEKIANEYASLFQGKQKTAKFQSIMKSKDELSLLTAKLEEAKSLLGSSSVKVASSNDSWRKPTIYSEQGKSHQKSASTEGLGMPTSFVNI